MHSNAETKCKNTSENSNKCQKTRNYQSYGLIWNAIKIKYFGAIWSSLKRKACNFTRDGNLQSSSTTLICSLHWESCMCENTGGAPTGCTQRLRANSHCGQRTSGLRLWKQRQVLLWRQLRLPRFDMLWTVHPQIQHAQCFAQHDHISSREHAWLKSCKAQDCTYLCPWDNCHARVMSFFFAALWHWPQAQVPYHLLHFSVRRSLPLTQALWRTIHIYPSKMHCRVAEQRKSHLSQVLSQKWSIPKILRLEELSLTGILGPIRTKHRKDLLEKLPEPYRRRYGWQRKSWCRDVLLPVADSLQLRLSGKYCRLRLWWWRTTKNAGFTTVFARSREL